MKTTVEIADALLEEANRIAAEEETSLQSLLEEGLRSMIERRREQPSFRLRDASFSGNGYQPGVRADDWEQILRMSSRWTRSR